MNRGVRRSHRTCRVLAAAAIACALSFGPRAARAAGVDPEAATPVQREQAQARFVRGKRLYDQKDYAAALDDFRASMEIVASPNARLYAARCLRESGQLVAAYVEFGRTEVEAREHARADTRYARTGPAAASERDELAPKLGFLTVHVQHAGDATKLTIAQEEIRRAAWGEPAPVMPGVTEVIVEATSTPPVRQSVSIAAGEKKVVDIDLEARDIGPATTSTPAKGMATVKLMPLAYAAGGLGAAGLITFGVAGLLSDSVYSDLHAHCPAGRCPSSDAPEISRGRTDQTVANVGLVVGLVGAMGGAAVLLYVRFHKGAEVQTTSGSTLVVSPVWTGWRGTF